MSDPVTNVEIEDVLSSIRRLVSCEERVDEADVHRPEAQDDAGDDRLVLTPAQRVDDPPEGGAVTGDVEIETPGAAPTDGWLDHVEDAELIEAEEELAEEDVKAVEIPSFIRRPFDPAPELEEDTASEEHSASEDDSFAEVMDEGEEALAEEAYETIADGQDDASQGDDLEAAIQADLKALEERIAGFETAVAAQEDQWEPDGSSEDEYAGSAVEPLPWEEAEEDTQETAAPEEIAEEQGQLPEPEERDAVGAVEEVEAVEAVEQDLRPEPEPEIAPAPEFEPAPEAKAQPELAPQAIAAASVAEGDEKADDGWYGDDAVLDEDALRDMVSEIVRQELQGALGERITRNVRKLVRREIHRALMSQGID